LWQWTNGWADEQLGYGVGEAHRKIAEDQLARLDPGLVRDYLRHAATAPAHIAMASAVGARLDTAPGGDSALLDRLEERAQRLWSTGASAHESVDRWSSWRRGLEAHRQELANQALHLAVERHPHPGLTERVITRPADMRRAIDRNIERPSKRAAVPATEHGRRTGGGRGR
jgi:hypothetical protein